MYGRYLRRLLALGECTPSSGRLSLPRQGLPGGRPRHPPSGRRRVRGGSPRSVTESSYGDVRGQSPSPLTGMSEVSHRVLLRGCFFFFLRIFLRPGIMFVSLYVCMSVPLFKRCGWGARFIYYNVINTFKQCGVCL
jgi:hypothetical protein